jgi:hypothetical protein
MSKQVRLRRGTTAQHATFTGAQGEVTFDTDRNCLIVHDGVTPGGVPLDVFALVMGNLIAKYPILSSYQAWFSEKLISTGSFQLGGAFQRANFFTFAYASTITIDPSVIAHGRITLAGNLTIQTTNLGGGREYRLIIYGDASVRTLAFPATWMWLGSAAPANIAANKAGILELICMGTTDDKVFARWSVQQ